MKTHQILYSPGFDGYVSEESFRSLGGREVSEPFRIHEYDGSELVVLQSAERWITL